MQIIWYGQSCFKILGKDVTLITDPYGGKYLSKPFKGKADIITVSHHDDDHAYTKGIMGDPLLIDSPGAYEIKKVMISGISSFHDKKQGQERGLNTIYTLRFEDINICHLGDLGCQLTDKQLGAIGDVDILLIPVGGTYTLDAAEAAKVTSAIEPRLIIPMHYKIPDLKIKLDTVDKFLKEMGSSAPPQPKLKISRKDLPEEESNVIVLEKN